MEFESSRDKLNRRHPGASFQIVALDVICSASPAYDVANQEHDQKQNDRCKKRYACVKKQGH